MADGHDQQQTEHAGAQQVEGDQRCASAATTVKRGADQTGKNPPADTTGEKDPDAYCAVAQQVDVGGQRNHVEEGAEIGDQSSGDDQVGVAGGGHIQSLSVVGAVDSRLEFAGIRKRPLTLTLSQGERGPIGGYLGGTPT
ncbi:hypothetical protein D3C81_1753310 [compost metagenome]